MPIQLQSPIKLPAPITKSQYTLHYPLMVLAFVCFLKTSPPSFAETFTAAQEHAQQATTDPALQLHTELIEMALQTDAYNRRCRGISVSKLLHKVNRLYITKYDLTANNFIKNYIDSNVKQLKIDRQHRFNKTLSGLGGCQNAQAKTTMKRLKKTFKTHYEQAEKSPWYPEVH